MHKIKTECSMFRRSRLLSSTCRCMKQLPKLIICRCMKQLPKLIINCEVFYLLYIKIDMNLLKHFVFGGLRSAAQTFILISHQQSWWVGILNQKHLYSLSICLHLARHPCLHRWWCLTVFTFLGSVSLFVDYVTVLI